MRPLWQPDSDRVRSSHLTRLTHDIARAHGCAFATYPDLHRWSVEYPADFWTAMWRYAEVLGTPGDVPALALDDMPLARFFPYGRLSFTANLLRRSDDHPAIIATTESGRDRQLSFADLGREVAKAALALGACGVRPGDRVAGIVPNTPEAVIAALGSAAIGAVWSSCSPDFGADAIVDRFGQIAPKVLITVDGYDYGGRYFDCLATLAEVRTRLPTVVRTVVISYGPASSVGPASDVRGWDEWLSEGRGELEPEQFAFNHPLYILYSSGTTGPPKAIVHGAGGTLLQHLKEHQMHCDVRRDDRVLYFTTTGWMMWHWLVTALASGATIVLYDGSPVHPHPGHLFDLADRTGVTLFGTSARYLDAIRTAGLEPRRTHDLSSIRTITSTGSPLAPETFDFVYASIKEDVHLASISGGSDIIGCFVLGNPNAPVWRGEIQAAGLGMDVRVFDDTGRPVSDHDPGELVAATPFPSMPLGFWNDAGDVRYRATYFDRFPGVWCHGDWIRSTPNDGYVIAGRSDATLKPGGVRIGTAEIYRQVQQVPDVVDSLAIGQRWQGDERIVLFLCLAPGRALDDDLRGQIISRLRTHASPRHVPARIIQVSDLPRTRSGKLAELAVSRVVHGQPVPNRDALANPEALDLFRDVPELRS